ncbi:MAG TPA: metallopeptidase TldD-related protein [Vicinamibacterales bacterium]|jgi:hypothetical protein
MRIRNVAAATAVLGLALSLTASTAPSQGSATTASDAAASPILAAMQDELKRSMAELKLRDEPPPYYIAYEVDEVASSRITSQLGAIVSDALNRSGTLRVEVRVGDYNFDSSRFVVQGRGGVVPISGEAAIGITLDKDYDALRRQIWLLTDAVYKRAVTAFARKKAAFQNRAVTEVIPDFSQQAPVDTVLSGVEPVRDMGDWAERVKKVSAVFASNADLQTSEVSVSDTRGTHYYINSEGSTVVAPIQFATVQLSAETQADDGMVLHDRFEATETRLQDLPSVSALTTRALEAAARVSAARTAPLGEEYTGPVLIEGEASAQLAAQTLVPLMLARRAPDADSIRITQLVQGQVTPFLSRIGLRVLPDAFSVTDTPSLKQFEDRPVPGSYVADDEGTPAQDVTLVEKGRLVTLLTNRTPNKHLPRSNGHGRGGNVQAGVFQMQSAQAVPAAEMKARYLELLKLQSKEFGYIVRVLDFDDTPGAGLARGPIILHATKISLDGTESPVRGLRFADIPFASFKDITDASQERKLQSYRAQGGAVVSLIVPDLMFEELEIQRISDIAQKPPIVRSPLKDPTVVGQ